jgi:acyl-CoA thioesterase-1
MFALFLLGMLAQPASRVIVCYGDSLTAGFGVASGQSYPDYLQKKLSGWQVVNLGVSGDTSSGGVARLSSALERKPSIVVLELGANDGLRGLPLKTTRANLEQMITAFRKAGARVVLAGMTLPPNYGKEYIRDFEAMYQELARKHRLTLIPFLLDGVANPGSGLMDGLHPTARGNERVAETVFKALRPLLR